MVSGARGRPGGDVQARCFARQREADMPVADISQAVRYTEAQQTRGICDDAASLR